MAIEYDQQGGIILDHSLCLKCQGIKGDPHLCSSCQWALAVEWLSHLERKHKESCEALI